MPLPICCNCKVEMPCVKNDSPVHDRGVVEDKVAGSVAHECWLGDKYECQFCGAAIVTGFGRGFISTALRSDSMAFSRPTFRQGTKPQEDE